MKEFGWVIPLPAPPEKIAAIENGEEIFNTLSFSAEPIAIEKGMLFCIIIFLIGVLLLGIGLAKLARKPMFSESRFNPTTLRDLGICLIAVGMWLFSIFGLHLSFQEYEVLLKGSAGIFDYTVIRADKGKTILNWLSENGYQFRSEDEAVLDSYAKRKWCFYAARIRPDVKRSAAVDAKVLLDPLLFRFPAEEPVYPLALTGSAGRPLDLILNVLADHGMETDAPLELKFAGPLDEPFDWSRMRSDPKTPIAPGEFSGRYLTRFRGTLQPSQMAADLVLSRAKNDRRYRPIEIR